MYLTTELLRPNYVKMCLNETKTDLSAVVKNMIMVVYLFNLTDKLA